MNVLIACEESQRVCEAFRAKGHNAFSCDIMECSGGHPEWHIREDVLEILNPHYIEDVAPEDRCEGIEFCTDDMEYHFIKKWDLIIAHPPCTYLTITGNRWFNLERYGAKAAARLRLRAKAIAFFMAIANADCERIAIENPVGIMSTAWRKPDQILQPWQFATDEEEQTEKTTCLWLKGLDPLEPINKEKPDIKYHEWTTPSGKKKRQTMWYYKTRCLPHAERAAAASKTFFGIAQAMADRWGG